MEAAILSAFHETSANAQMAQDAISFMTAKAGGGCEWSEAYYVHQLTFNKATSGSPAKNPSKMFRQPAGTGGAASVFARPRMSLQGVQIGTWLGMVTL